MKHLSFAILLRRACASLFLLVMGAAPALASEGMPNAGWSRILDILLMVFVVFFIFRAFRRRSGNEDQEQDRSRMDMRDIDDSQDDADGKMRRGVDRYEAARRSWEYFQTGEARPEPVENAPQAAHGQGDFDSSEFLEGAKIFFSRFQEAGDNRDLDSIRDFISDEVYAQAVADLETGGVAARTEIMLLDARLVDVRTENGTTSVTVQFDADLRKGISGEQREHVRTVWEFSRDETVPGSLWTLDKINRMDH